jgi:phage terminase small subunit
LKERAKLSIDDLRTELVKIISFDITNIVHFNESGVIFTYNSDDIPDKAKSALQSIEVTEIHGKDREGNLTLKTKVKVHDKLKAIELYGKTLGAFIDKKEVDSKGEISVEWLNVPALKPPGSHRIEDEE